MVPFMAKSPSPKHLAARICTALYDLKGAHPHWVSLGEVCKQMQEPHSPAMDTALKYANDEDLVSCSPPPVHSMMLTYKGVQAARDKLKRAVGR